MEKFDGGSRKWPYSFFDIDYDNKLQGGRPFPEEVADQNSIQ